METAPSKLLSAIKNVSVHPTMPRDNCVWVREYGRVAEAIHVNALRMSKPHM